MSAFLSPLPPFFTVLLVSDRTLADSCTPSPHTDPASSFHRRAKLIAEARRKIERLTSTLAATSLA